MIDDLGRSNNLIPDEAPLSNSYTRRSTSARPGPDYIRARHGSPPPNSFNAIPFLEVDVRVCCKSVQLERKPARMAGWVRS